MSVGGLVLERASSRALTAFSLKVALAFGALTAALAPIAYMAMFSGFHAYDDEGYYLANLGDYLAGRPLLTPYAQVYGPFFYEVVGGLFKVLGLAPDNDNGRLVTVGAWLIASVAGGLVAFRLSRSLWLGLAAQLLTFAVLTVLSNEPMSTYGLSTILLLGLTAAATFRPARPRATAALIGAIVAALCLIKINVGGFAALAAVLAWAASLPQRWRRLLLPSMVGVITALPFVFTLSLLSTTWVLEFAVVVAFSAAAVGVSSLVTLPTSFPPPSGTLIAAGGMVVVIASLGVALAGGTRLSDIWDGLVVAPLRFPRLFTLPINLNAGYDLMAALFFVGAIALSVRSTIGGVSAAAAGLVRICAGLVMWLSMLLLPDPIFLLALPLAWVAVQAPKHEPSDPVGPYARLLVPALAVLESLQPYPIAGSQLSMAALGFIPVGAICFGDGIRQLRAADIARGAKANAVGAVAPASLLANVAFLLVGALTVTAGFVNGTPLGLPGAESVRLQAQPAAELRQLVAAVDRDCSTFVTFPGMNSLYIWTAKAPPTPVRVEVWWLVLDNSEQQSLVQQLTGMPGLCVIKNQRAIDMWAGGRDVPRTPLVDFIDRQFVRDGSYGDYELLVRAS